MLKSHFLQSIFNLNIDALKMFPRVNQIKPQLSYMRNLFVWTN